MDLCCDLQVELLHFLGASQLPPMSGTSLRAKGAPEDQGCWGTCSGPSLWR